MNKTVRKEFECQSDYILSDYMGDVKKILSCSAVATEVGRLVSENEVQLSGCVDFSVLYSDVEGNLTPVSYSADYDVTLPIENDVECEVATATRVTNFAVRANGPRKLSLKAFCEGEAHFKCCEQTDAEGTAFGEGKEPEIATRVILTEDYIYAESEEKEYADELLHLDSVSSDGLEVIASSGSVRITSAEVVNGEVRLNGEILLVAIVKTDEQPPFAIKKSIPFDESISLESVSEQMLPNAMGTVSAISTAISEEGDGAALNLSCKLKLSCVLAKNESRSVISDAYLKNWDTACEYEPFPYNSFVSMGTCERFLKNRVQFSAIGLENPREILWSVAEARSVESTKGENGIVVSGEILVSCVACEVNEYSQPVYTSAKMSIPFSENVNCGCQISENSLIGVEIIPLSVDFALDGDGCEAVAMVSLSYKITEPAIVTRLKRCDVVGDAPFEKNGSVITVYYPDPDETLFDIAKKHHTGVLKICEDNGISEAVMADSFSCARASGIKKLIIS